MTLNSIQVNSSYVNQIDKKLHFACFQIENQSIEQGAPLREVYAVEAIADLPEEAATEGSVSTYKGRPEHPFQAQVFHKEVKIKRVCK